VRAPLIVAQQEHWVHFQVNLWESGVSDFPGNITLATVQFLPSLNQYLLTRADSLKDYLDSLDATKARILEVLAAVDREEVTMATQRAKETNPTPFGSRVETARR
jgi:hypothetical protein